MTYPKSVLAIAYKMARKHDDDLDKATALAEEQIRKLAEFETFAADVLHQAVADAVQEQHRLIASGVLHTPPDRVAGALRTPPKPLGALRHVRTAKTGKLVIPKAKPWMGRKKVDPKRKGTR